MTPCLTNPSPWPRRLGSSRVPRTASRWRRSGTASARMELARAREEVGRLNGQLEEVRAQNARLREELKDSATERRRLAAEVLDLRAAAEERLMERIEHIACVEKEPAESSS